MIDFIDSPMFFYSMALVIFTGLAWRFGKKPVIGWLDAEILKIHDELERARSLRAEAEALLADYRRKHASAMAEATEIVRHADKEAAQIKVLAEADLKAMLARQEQQAASRIRLAETEAEAAVRAAVIETAIAEARKALAAKANDAPEAMRLADAAIAEVPRLAGIRAKAA